MLNRALNLLPATVLCLVGGGLVYQLGAKRIEDLYVIEGAARPCCSAPADVKASRLFYYSPETVCLGSSVWKRAALLEKPSVTMYLLKGERFCLRMQ